MFKKGLNAFQLKMIALICMVFDHIHYMLAGQLNIPFWFGIIGRISAPIFIYITAYGMAFTRNRKRFMLRLYSASVLMAVGNMLVNEYLPHPNGNMIINNIFATMFLITVYIVSIDMGIKAFKEKSVKKGLISLLIFILPILTSILGMQLFSSTNVYLIRAYFTLIPSILFVEGGFLMVILGVGFYCFRNSKKATAIYYTLFSAFVFYLMIGNGFNFVNLFTINYQWLMILALPFILSYNLDKGRTSKWFFYVFYPAHVYGLLILSRIIGI